MVFDGCAVFPTIKPSTSAAPPLPSPPSLPISFREETKENRRAVRYANREIVNDNAKQTQQYPTAVGVGHGFSSVAVQLCTESFDYVTALR